MVRALASHKCGPGSNPGGDPIWGLSLLLVLLFSPLLKNQHFQIPIWPGFRYTRKHSVDVLPLNNNLFIYLFSLCSWWEWQTFWADYLTFKLPSVYVPVYTFCCSLREKTHSFAWNGDQQRDDTFISAKKRTCAYKSDSLTTFAF